MGSGWLGSAYNFAFGDVSDPQFDGRGPAGGPYASVWDLLNREPIPEGLRDEDWAYLSSVLTAGARQGTEAGLEQLYRNVGGDISDPVYMSTAAQMTSAESSRVASGLAGIRVEERQRMQDLEMERRNMMINMAGLQASFAGIRAGLAISISQMQSASRGQNMAFTSNIFGSAVGNQGLGRENTGTTTMGPTGKTNGPPGTIERTSRAPGSEASFVDWLESQGGTSPGMARTGTPETQRETAAAQQRSFENLYALYAGYGY